MKKELSTVEAIKEARRCADCDKVTCQEGCPLQINISAFIKDLSQGNFGSAYATIAEVNDLPSICARVCPAERQCEALCILQREGNGIAISDLEGFIADFAHDNGLKMAAPHCCCRGKVAIIGSGPAGLAAAGYLVKNHFGVTIFEAQSEPGGMLLFGIPEYRLPSAIVRREIAELQQSGVEIRVQKRAGIDFTIDDLFGEGYDAIFMAVGTSLPKTLDIPGKELSSILTASYFLRTDALANVGKLDKSEIVLHTGDRVVVVGAGNVAMDSAITAMRRGASEVTVVYHKSEKDISAHFDKYRQALSEGVQFRFMQQPVAYFNHKQMRAINNVRKHAGVQDDLSVAGILLQNIEEDKDGNYVASGGQEVKACECVILAIGQRPTPPIITTTQGIQLDENGFVVTKERPYGMTTRAGVFSSGEVVHGPATVVLAMKDSQKVAAAIAQYIDAKKLLEG